jgi:hypothetical protein
MDLTMLRSLDDPQWSEVWRGVKERRLGWERLLVGLQAGVTVVVVIGQVLRKSLDSNTLWVPPGMFCLAVSGDTVKVESSNFEPYFREVRHWDLNYQWDADSGEARAIAVSRARTPIGVSWRVHRDAPGVLYIVPPVTSVPAEQGMLMLLRDVCRLEIGPLPPPAWIAGFPVPNQELTLQEIETRKDNVKNASNQLQASRDQLAKMQGVRRLLFETGEELRQAILDAFEELGAKARSREDNGNEDGILDCEFGVGVLEAKKSAKGCAKSDVRQLDEWVRNLLLDGVDGKGILVLNHFADLPPNERGKPFESNIIDFARTSRKKPFCLMTSIQLFKEVCAVRAGRVEARDILRRVHEAEGVYEASE